MTVVHSFIIAGGSCLSWIFWKHENLPGLSVLIYIKLYKEKEKKTFLAKNPG